MSWQHDRTMGPEEFQVILKWLNLNKSSAARYLGISLSTSQRWWNGTSPVPVAHALLLRALLEMGEKPQVPNSKGTWGRLPRGPKAGIDPHP